MTNKKSSLKGQYDECDLIIQKILSKKTALEAYFDNELKKGISRSEIIKKLHYMGVFIKNSK